MEHAPPANPPRGRGLRSFADADSYLAEAAWFKPGDIDWCEIGNYRRVNRVQMKLGSIGDLADQVT